MKKKIIASSLVVTIIGAGMIVGCGGSGSSDKTSNDGSAGKVANLDVRSVNTLGKNAANLIPGCVYTSNAVSTVLNDHHVKAYKSVYNRIVKLKHSRVAGQQPTAGSCGGEMTQSTTGNNISYQFTDFCNGDANNKVTLNGSLQVSMVQEGEVVKSVTASTGASGLNAITVEDGVTSTDKLYLDGLSYTQGNPSVLKIDELKVDSSTDGVYRLTNVNVEESGELQTGTVEIKSATYYDPDVGAVTLSTSPLPLNDAKNGTATPATITVSSQGDSATFKTDDLQTGTFDVFKNSNLVGKLDCSTSLTQIGN